MLLGIRSRLAMLACQCALTQDSGSAGSGSRGGAETRSVNRQGAKKRRPLRALKQSGEAHKKQIARECAQKHLGDLASWRFLHAFRVLRVSACPLLRRNIPQSVPELSRRECMSEIATRFPGHPCVQAASPAPASVRENARAPAHFFASCRSWVPACAGMTL